MATNAKIVRCFGRQFNLKLITVEPIMFLYMFMMFTQFLTLQALVYDKVCHEAFNSTVCDNLNNKTFKAEEDVVQKRSSTWFLYVNLAMGIPSLLTVVLFLGPWGDRVGRKIPVIAPLIGAFLAALSYFINSVYMDLAVGYMLIGSFLNGLFGGYIAALMAMYSYVASVATTENRTIRIGILEAMIFLAATLGTCTSGVMLDNTSYVFVFSVLSGVICLALVYALIWLENIVPERPEDDGPESSGLCRTLLLDSIKEIFVCVYHKRHSKHFFNLALLMVMIFCTQLVTVGENDIILLFTRDAPFHWSQTTLGLYKGVETSLRGIAVLTILVLFKRRLKARDTTVIICGLASKTMALVVLGVGNNTAILFIGAVSGIMQGFSSAGIRSMCSGMVKNNEQAKVFSLMGIFESFSQLAATSLFNTVYGATLNLYHGLCFLLAAIFTKVFSLMGIFESFSQLAATSLFNTVYGATLNLYHGLCFLMAAGIIGSNIFIALYLHFKLRGEQTYETLQDLDVPCTMVQENVDTDEPVSVGNLNEEA